MRPTIGDVAKKAGVSISTASRVLNESGYVSEATRKKVLQVSTEISYSANYFARGLKGKQPGIIGLINKNYLHPFFTSVATGIEQEAKRHDLGILSVCSEDDPDEERRGINLLFNRNIFDLIFATPTAVENIKYAQEYGAHCVVIERDLGYEKVDRVLYNNYAAGMLIARKFLESGFTRIGYIGMDPSFGSVEQERYLGFKEFLEKNGVSIDPELDFHTGKEYSIPYGKEISRKLFDRRKRLDALMVGCDFLLIGLIQQLDSLGLKIPQDISIVSADNFYSYLVSPEVDSIDYSLDKLGRKAIQLFQKTDVKEQRRHRTVVIDPFYVTRSSVRKP